MRGPSSEREGARRGRGCGVLRSRALGVSRTFGVRRASSLLWSMPVNRWTPALSALALCLGLVLIVGLRPATPVVPPASAVAALTASPAPSPTGLTATPTATTTATPIPAIPPGYRVKIARLAIDLPIAEGDIERDTVRQQTPDNFAFHFPGTAIPGDAGNTYIYAHARRGMFLSLWSARVGDEVLIVTPEGR